MFIKRADLPAYPAELSEVAARAMRGARGRIEALQVTYVEDWRATATP
jgi:hypothetical protein